MSDIYEYLVQAMRQHWKLHSNANPQQLALTPTSWQTLNATRELVNASMGFTLVEGWQQAFQGVPIVHSDDVDALVDLQGVRQPLSAWQPPPEPAAQ